MLTTAVLVDGGFFLKRFRFVYPDLDDNDPIVVARTMHKMALAHLYAKSGKRIAHLYRIFFYDCPPLAKKVHRPVSGRSHDFSKDGTSKFRLALHDEVKRLRKTALRLGRRDEENATWQINPKQLKDLISGKIQFTDLTDADFTYYAKQKVVDMKIGLDIASIAHKRLANQIILIAGDSDFVPAAKQARREGIDFVLDPMWNHINPDLNEHIDGLRSTAPNPSRRHITPTFVPADDDIEELLGGDNTTE
jgi:uncharacterized LabA/DUF88 family protein